MLCDFLILLILPIIAHHGDMTVSASFFFALKVYGLSAIISFFVALLIKGLFVGLNYFEATPPPVTTLANEMIPAPKGMSPELIAIITAAATVTVGKKVRVTAIQRPVGNTTWAQQGRVSIMTSHKTKH